MPSIVASETLNTSLSVEALEQERAAFTSDLVDAGLVSSEFAESGVLQRFDLDPKTGIDSLRHVLVGDISGGCHHTRTVTELGLRNRVIAAEVHDPNRPDRELSSFKRQQKLKANGVYGANIIQIVEDGIAYSKLSVIERDGEKVEIASGSTMFPDAWSSEDVLKAIVQVADTTPINESARGSDPRLAHDATVNGVRIKVITDKASGKIITGAPVHGDR